MNMRVGQITLRLPLAPLLAWCGEPDNLVQAALKLNVPRRTLHRWRHIGIDVHQADRIITRLSGHLYEVWPELASVEVELGEEEHA